MGDLPQTTPDNRNATMLGVRALQNIADALKGILPSFGGTATSATAGTATLPSNPAGFVEVTINGSIQLLPYYNP